MERFPFKRQLTISRSTLSTNEVDSPSKTTSSHRKSKSNSTTPLFINPSQAELDEIQTKIQKIQKYFEKLRNEIVSSTTILIDKIKNQSKLALNTIIEHEFDLLTLHNSAKRGKAIPIEKMQAIYNFFVPKELDKLKIDPILKEIEKIFNSKEENLGKSSSNRVTQELICCKDYITGLLSIDLTTFQVNQIKSAPKVFPYSSITQISDSKIFITGGYNGSTSLNEAFILDLESNSYDSIPSKINRDASAIVMKGNQIFVFGGIEKKEVSLKICECFDLVAYRWNRIADLPYECHSNTATLVENRIFVLGFQADYLLEFNDLTQKYSQIISVPKDCMKFVFGNWIITPDEILEFDVSSLRWKRYCFPSTLKFGWLLTYNCAKIENFIYFIDDINGLLRLDTIQKKIDKIV